MKNAPVQITNESAPDNRDYTPGRLLKRLQSIRAAVLANALESNTTTGMAAVFAQSTTRLSAVIFALKEDYGWIFESKDIAVGTKAGRVSYISVYWLPQAVITKAFEAGAREWVAAVNASQIEQRKMAGQSRKRAALINARKFDPRQADMWGA